MAYEFNLADAQYDAVYEFNLDYLMSVNGRNDAYGTWRGLQGFSSLFTCR